MLLPPDSHQSASTLDVFPSDGHSTRRPPGGSGGTLGERTWFTLRIAAAGSGCVSALGRVPAGSAGTPSPAYPTDICPPPSAPPARGCAVRPPLGALAPFPA